MADRPELESVPDGPNYTGGWRKPSTSTAAPAVESAPAAPQAESGWKTVPALPANLQVEPEQKGAWHLPRPEDTVFDEDSETAIKPERQAIIESRPEDFLLNFTAEAVTTPEADEALPADEGADSESLLTLELQDAAKSAEAEEEPDEGTFSMSELVALSSLVEQMPKSSIVLKEAAPAEVGGEQKTSPEEKLSQTGGQPSAEDYARKQLEILNAGGTGAATAAGTGPTQAVADPGEYARQQLAQISAGMAGAAPAAATPQLTPRQQQLAQQFADTEIQVRALRSSRQAGQISDEQLQEQLKKLMILDDQNVWWMMGVQSDIWYRYDGGQWVQATPPYSPAGLGTAQPAAGRAPVPTATTNLDPSQVLAGGSLPYFPTAPQPVTGQTEPTQATAAFQTGGFGITEELGLPRENVPITDPDRTMVSPAGAIFGQMSPGAAPTLQNMGAVSEPTVMTQRIDPGMYDPNAPLGAGVGAPVQAEAFPQYDANLRSPTAEAIAQEEQDRTFRTLLTLGAVAVGAVILLVACGVGFILLQYNSMVSTWQTQIAALANYQPQFQTARILDMNGQLIAEINSQQGGARTTVALDKVSPFMVHAIISLEDLTFYQDAGWDWGDIVNSFVQNTLSGQFTSSTSSITQKIAEQLVLQRAANTPELRWQQLVIASQIAQQYDKSFIIQLYLNEIFFGNSSYGVEAASQFYFGHAAVDLTLPEAALLAGMIQNPAQYDPVRSSTDDQVTYENRRQLVFQRMDYVIQQMTQVGCLQFQHAPYLNRPFCVDSNVVRQAAVQKAQVVTTEYRPRDVRFRYPHFVDFVTQQVEAVYGPGEMYRRGFVIRTTLNPALQDAADQALDQQIAALVNTGVNTGAIMVVDPRTGAIRAMVGSPNFNDTSINGSINAALTRQQPGSAIYPLTYVAALEGLDTNGDGRADSWFTPATVLWDVPTTFGGTLTPANFDGRSHGPVALRYALQNSYNIAAMKAYQYIGEAKFRDLTGRLGLTFPEGATFSLGTGLGQTEVTLYGMMQAYGTLANSGNRMPLYGVESITDADNNPIPLPANLPQKAATPTKGVEPQVAFLVSNILSDDVARADMFGRNGPMIIQGLPTSGVVAAKTGVTDGARDLWTMGYTNNVVVGVWLGRPDDQATAVRDGGYGSAAQLWNRVMIAALQNLGSPSAFANPPGLIQQQVCILTGTLPPSGCTGLRTELFLDSQRPPGPEQAFVQQVNIDTWTGYISNEFCPDNREARTYLNITDPTAISWLNSTEGRQTAIQLGITSGTLTSLPANSCDVNTEIPIARILSPQTNAVLSGVVPIAGVATAPTTFRSFQLEYALASSPNNWTLINQPITTPQNQGTLGTWDTTNIASGQYILRLTMNSNTNGVLYRTVNVTVANTQPTAQPTAPVLIITATPLNNSQTSGQGQFVPATATPLPFEQVPVVPSGGQ